MGIAEPSGLEGLSWRPVPGAFELLERGDLDDDAPDFDRLPLPTPTRGLNQDELAGRWRRMLDRLRGYAKDEVLVSAEPLWVPIIDLHVPPGGASTFTYSSTRGATNGLDLRIFGVGFGNAATVTFGDSLTLPANETAKSLRLRLLVTATRYVSRTGDDLIRIDAQMPDTGPEHQVVDLLEQPIPDLTDPLAWTVVRRQSLSGSADSGSFTWSYSVGTRARWEVGIGVPKAISIGAELGLTVEADRADEVKVSFEMPYGKDYVFYTATGHVPLAPFCAVVA